MGIVMVTGASRGIGRAVATRLASSGHDVAITYREREVDARAVVDACRSSGARCIAMPLDVAVEAEVETAFRRVDDELGTLTGLVNNAGTVGLQMRLDQMSAHRIEATLAVNVVGAFVCAREAVRRMSTAHGGSGGAIVNVSSAASRLGSPNEYIDYAASKGAIDTMTIGLAKEVGAEGIRVNAVRPGIIDTEIHARGGEPDRIDRVAPSVPLRRAGDVDEVAAIVAWLLSDEASYVSGALVDVTGGR